MKIDFYIKAHMKDFAHRQKLTQENPSEYYTFDEYDQQVESVFYQYVDGYERPKLKLAALNEAYEMLPLQAEYKQLPTLLFIKAVAIFEHIMKLRVKQIERTFGERLSLEELIDYFGKFKSIDTARLHELRARRNRVCHRVADYVTWNELQKDAETIRTTLRVILEEVLA